MYAWLMVICAVEPCGIVVVFSVFTVQFAGVIWCCSLFIWIVFMFIVTVFQT